MDSLLSHLLDAASRAPSAHNTQPWALRWLGDSLEIAPRADRSLPAIDPEGVETLHALGACLENVSLTLGHLGFVARYEVDLRGGVVVRWTPSEGPRPDPSLYRMIPIRRTSRLPYGREPIGADDLAAISAAVAPPCSLAILERPDDVMAVRRLVAEATVEQLRERAVSAELYEWVRFSRRDRRWFRDGLNAACLGWSRAEAAVLRVLLSPRALRLGGSPLARFLGGDLAKNAPEAPALALLIVDGDSGEADRGGAVPATSVAHGGLSRARDASDQRGRRPAGDPAGGPRAVWRARGMVAREPVPIGDLGGVGPESSAAGR